MPCTIFSEIFEASLSPIPASATRPVDTSQDSRGAIFLVYRTKSQNADTVSKIVANAVGPRECRPSPRKRPGQ